MARIILTIDVEDLKGDDGLADLARCVKGGVEHMLRHWRTTPVAVVFAEDRMDIEVRVRT